MTRNFTTLFALLTVLVGSLVATGTAAADQVRISQHAIAVCGPAEGVSGAASSGNQVIFKEVQQTQEYNVKRPEVPSGARLTLFANFLGSEKGYVMLNLGGTSTQCEVIEWKDRSVTAELPKLGLLGPKNAEIQLVRPDGRIVKTFRILLVHQPDILVHGDTVPQPLPPAPVAETGAFAVP